jgi:hypothetical protein
MIACTIPVLIFSSTDMNKESDICLNYIGKCACVYLFVYLFTYLFMVIFFP